jgi:hypothetical protein
MGLARDVDNKRLAVDYFTFQPCVFFEENRGKEIQSSNHQVKINLPDFC